VQWCSDGVGMRKVQGRAPSSGNFLVKNKLREFMGVLCTWVKLLTDLQILGCELHKKMRLVVRLRMDPLGEL